jgi:hypothetical protein
LSAGIQLNRREGRPAEKGQIGGIPSRNGFNAAGQYWIHPADGRGAAIAVNAKLGCWKTAERMPANPIYSAGMLRGSEQYDTSVITFERAKTAVACVELECPTCGQPLSFKVASADRVQLKMILAPAVASGSTDSAFDLGWQSNDHDWWSLHLFCLIIGRCITLKTRAIRFRPILVSAAA